MGTVTRKWLRHGTMAMIVVIVAGMGLLIADRVRHLSTPIGEVDPSEMVGSGDDPVEGIYTGFRYVETVAGQLIFVLNSQHPTQWRLNTKRISNTTRNLFWVSCYILLIYL